MEKHGRHGSSARLKQRWCGLVVLMVLLATIPSAPFVAATPIPAGLRPADWQSIQAQLPLTQQAYLKASNPGPGDWFGGSVAIDGDTVVVGAAREASSSSGVNATPNETAPDAGAAYVFVRSGTTWAQQAYLKASNPGAGDQFGSEVAISGDSIVVGAPFEDSSSSGVNATPNEAALDSGAAYVFVRSGTTWTEQAYLKASNPGAADRFGASVAITNGSVVIGAPREDSSSGINTTPNEAAEEAGAAYVFVRLRTLGGRPFWAEQAYLKASNPGPGDFFGRDVGGGGATVVIGAYGEASSTSGVNTTPNEAAAEAGAAYVFIRSGTIWTQQAYLKASNPGAGDRFGISVALTNEIVVVGAPFEDSSSSGVNATPNEAALDAGAAYVFVRSGTTWTQQGYLKASNPGAGDAFGMSVAISGWTVVLGALFEDSSTHGVNATPNEAAEEAGAAYVFGGSATTWTQQAYLKASNPGAGDAFGGRVAISNATVVVGADGEDSSSGVNALPNEAAAEAGAAYVFAVSRLYLPLVRR